ncbi:MAG: gliding motility lipoprotein GldH [Bacteroidales bacterium]|nr:gliding motility lipoprotein GldH [Bacteroidales bacterium]MBN2756534.1 gliding motility lipoprotein GldH [Bacteroidales bacterium]
MNKIVIGFIVMLSFSFIACNENVFYNKKYDISENTWNYEDTLSFNVNISDTSQLYNLYFSIKNTEEYQNSNLWLFITTSSPDGYMIKDTLEFFLSDDLGKWFGKKSSDNFITYHYFKRQVIFPVKGKYSFVIQQGMRQLDLYGINKFGLIIKKSGEK